MQTLAIAGSRGRLSLVTVETMLHRDKPRPTRTVTYHGRLPVQSTPTEQHAAVVRVAESLKQRNSGEEPRIVVSYGGLGTTLYQLLREDKRRGYSTLPDEHGHPVRYPRIEFPYPITSMGKAGESVARYYKPSVLAANLYSEWTNGRISFAPGLDKLRKQMGAFVPVESKAGNVAFGNEDMSDYDDAVVALMFACAVRGIGVMRFEDSQGNVWPSQAIAQARLGVAAENIYQNDVDHLGVQG